MAQGNDIKFVATQQNKTFHVARECEQACQKGDDGENSGIRA